VCSIQGQRYDVYIIASDSAGMNGQRLYLLSQSIPEPSAAVLHAAAILALACVARSRVAGVVNRVCPGLA
jgi:hypothetical protein